MFSYSTFSWGNITAGAVVIGEFAIIFVLPLYLINALDLSTMSAGLMLAAMAIGAFFSGAAARLVAARFGAPGTVLIGLGLEVIGVLILILLMGPDTNAWIIAAPLTLYGLGLGFASAQLTGTVLRGYSPSMAPGKPPQRKAPCAWGSGAGLKRRHGQRRAVVARRCHRIRRSGFCWCT